MKKLVLIILFLFFCERIISQDTIYFIDKTKVAAIIKNVGDFEVRYKLDANPTGPLYIVSKTDVNRIKYFNGKITIKDSIEKTNTKPVRAVINYDSIPLKKNFYRIYFTDIIYKRLGFGYERLINKRYSLELDVFYKFHNIIANNYYSTSWIAALHDNSFGGEVRLGVARHLYFRKARFSYGAAISYRQQSILNAYVDVTELSHRPDNGFYYLSQTKKGFGYFLKFNLQFNRQHSGIEFFIIPGLYSSFTKSDYHSYMADNNGVLVTDPNLIPKIKNKYFKDGHAWLPYINFGFDFTIKPPKKGWNTDIIQKRDSLKFNRKNIIFYNPVQLYDGALSFTYLRINYKRALSFWGATAIPVNNNKAMASNSILLEKNENYHLDKKTMDISLGINHNFSTRQESFPFIGLLARAAQFNGAYTTRTFLLNKYYTYLNSGFVLRERGFSFLASFALGHYFNHYLANNPRQLMDKDYAVQPKPYVINSLMASVQFGYSF